MNNYHHTQKLADISHRHFSFKEAIRAAEQNYRRWCTEHDEEPHQSKVHSFHDARQETYLLALPAKTPLDAKRLAELTYFVHLLDDKVDARPDFSKTRKKHCGTYRSFLAYSPIEVRRVAQKMISLGKKKLRKRRSRGVL